MTKYIKTAVTEFEQFDGSDEMIGKYDIDPEQIGEGMPMYQLETLKGTIQIFIGDWIATGVEGEHWPVKDEIFKKTYKKLPVIPKVLAKWIEACKRAGTPLLMMLDDTLSVEDLTQDDTDQIEDWMDAHTDNEVSNIISRAWLDGYEVAEIEVMGV
jgi:hypothetical protein